MGRRYGRHIFFRPIISERFLAEWTRSGGGIERRGATALVSRVHVRFVVVANVADVVTSFEHSRNSLHAYIDGSSIACNHHDFALFVSAECLKRHFNPRGDCCCVFKKRVDPRDFPSGLRILRGNDFHAAGCVCNEHVCSCCSQNCSYRERRAASCARSMTRR